VWQQKVYDAMNFEKSTINKLKHMKEVKNTFDIMMKKWIDMPTNNFLVYL
jgi:hypothetical protein